MTNRIVILVFALCVNGAVFAGCSDDRFDVANMKNEGSVFVGPLTMSDVEKEQTIQMPIEGKLVNIPFGYSNELWQKVKTLVASGAQLYLIRDRREILENRPSGEIIAYGAVNGNCVVELIMAVKK